MMNWKLLASVTCGLLVVGAFWSRKVFSRTETSASTPICKVVFGSDLKIEGHFLKGHVYTYKSPGFNSVETVSLQTLTQHYAKNVTPFPQNQVEDVNPLLSKSGNIGSNGQVTPLLKSELSFNHTDLRELNIDQQRPKWVRVKIAMVQDVRSQKDWTNPTSSVYFGPWLAYKGNATKP